MTHEPARGSWNMAVDEALIGAVEDAPILRIYGWDAWTVSLGRFQDVDADAFRGAPFPVVRRITGGGAILHGGELTYSVVMRRDDLGTAHVKESFRLLCAFLIEFYALLGWEARFAVDALPEEAAGTLGQRRAVCYAGKELYDVVINGRKIGGNAQRRFKSTIFQHGSIPITLNWEGLRRLFSPDELPAAGDLTSLEALGATRPRDELTALLVQAFSETVAGGALTPLPLTAREQRAAERLERDIYTADSWTFARSRRATREQMQ